MNYAVLDTETTGIYPGGHDRLVELAIVRLDSGLGIEREFSTLLNPERDVGPTWLHGIKAGDVLHAPAFEEIAGSVVDLVADAVVVGHNVSFDLRFLEAEFARAGCPIQRPPFFDTMSVALRMGATSRRLEEVCELFGISAPEWHSALGDARATAALFARCVEHLGNSRISDLIVDQNPAGYSEGSWPDIDPLREPFPRERAAAEKRDRASYLATLVRGLPASGSDRGDWQAYFSVLDRALEDRRISEDEVTALREAALECGMAAADVEAANRSYLRALVSLAVADGVISQSEREDIHEVGELLGLRSDVPELLAEPPEAQGGPLAQEQALEGCTVCFTGALRAVVDGDRITRAKAMGMAREHGMVVTRSVTKKLDYLVVADADSLSGKARKAREYGTRIIAESVFWNLLGVNTEG